MSGGQWSKEDQMRVIDELQSLIEGCIKLYMSKEECKHELQLHHDFDPELTEIIWNQIEKENGEFFRAYYVRLLVKEQITTFNRLLEMQWRLMQSEVSVSTTGPPEVESDTDMSDHTSPATDTSKPHN